MMRRTKPLFATLLSLGLCLAAPAWADDDDDFLDDILAPEGPAETTTTKSEREGLEQEAEDEMKAAAKPEAPTRKKVIKTLQRKTFLKLQRWEASPTVGFVTNDPFINRYLLGSNFTYHLTEIFGLELAGMYSPDFGQSDWKPITQQIITNNQVTPDISKIQYYGSVQFQFSPVYGKVAMLGRNIVLFDIFGVFGTGMVNTKDDLEALQKEGDEVAVNTEVQNHPTLNFGGGIRIVFSESFAFRFEGRGMSYIEVLESTTLEMKNNVMLQASASFFFPGLK